MRTTARREGDTWVLDGRKRWIGNGTFADLVVVWARDVADGKVRGFVVRGDDPGFAATRIDATRLGVAGHSMGGGGSLEAAASRPSLQAAVPLAPWNADKSWNTLRTPTLIIGGESDSVASVSAHAVPFYNSIPASAEKAYLELNNASHFFPQTTNTPTSRQMVAWLKRFVDNDTRYDQFICPGPSGLAIEEYRSTCPLS